MTTPAALFALLILVAVPLTAYIASRIDRKG